MLKYCTFIQWTSFKPTEIIWAAENTFLFILSELPNKTYLKDILLFFFLITIYWVLLCSIMFLREYYTDVTKKKQIILAGI